MSIGGHRNEAVTPIVGLPLSIAGDQMRFLCVAALALSTSLFSPSANAQPVMAAGELVDLCGSVERDSPTETACFMYIKGVLE